MVCRGLACCVVFHFLAFGQVAMQTGIESLETTGISNIGTENNIPVDDTKSSEEPIQKKEPKDTTPLEDSSLTTRSPSSSTIAKTDETSPELTSERWPLTVPVPTTEETVKTSLTTKEQTSASGSPLSTVWTVVSTVKTPGTTIPCRDAKCNNVTELEVVPSSSKVQVGETATLQCQGSSSEVGYYRVEWFKSSQEGKKTVPNPNWTLTIENAGLSNSGTYHCVAICCSLQWESRPGEVKVYEKPNYYKHLVYLGAMCILLMCFCVATVVFNYKRLKRMEVEMENLDDKEIVWLL